MPKADEWNAKAREHSLTPEDVQRILQTAFTQSSKQPEQDDKLSPILKIAAKVLRRANELKKKRDTFRREEAVLRMISYAVMEVSEVAGEATEDEVRYNRYLLFIVLILKGRIAGWLWEKIAEAIPPFCPYLVLGDGKFVLLEELRLAIVFYA